MTARIAVFLPSLRGGGAEKAVLAIAEGLGERGHQVDLVLVERAGPHVERAAARCRLVDLGARRTLVALPSLVGYLRRERPQALLTTLTHASAVAIVARELAGVPLRLVVREGNHVTRAAELSRGLRSRLMPRFARWVYPLADALVANSQGVADELVTGLELPAGKVSVIPNLLPLDEMAARAADAGPPVAGLEEPPWIVAAGRLVPQKDFATLLAAFALVRRASQARLVILGEGPEREALGAQAARLGLSSAVTFAGFQANPYPWLARGRVFALSSRWEGSPNVLAEAMALGVPVVATDCPSGPAELLAGGRLGRLVPVGDSAALAAAILATLAAPSAAADLRAAARRHAPEIVLPRYEDLLLGTRGGGR